MQPRTERRIPIDNVTEVALTSANTGTFVISSVTDTDTLVLAAAPAPSAVNDFYNGLRFRREAIVPTGVATEAYSRASRIYTVADYVGASRTLGFVPANTAAGDFVANDLIVIGPSLPAAFEELNIGGGASAFKFALVSGATARTDYMEIAAGLYRTFSSHEFKQLKAIYLLSNAVSDTITVEYK